MDGSGYFQKMAFVGGTALRIIYDLKRFSEDLDFSLINKDKFDFTEFVDKLIYEMSHESLTVEQKLK